MTTRTTSVPHTPVSPDTAPDVQLAHADVAQATEPGLFDHLPNSALTAHHRTLIKANPADRMLLCLSLDVSPSAGKVASALAYHGWSSWPSRDTLASRTNLHPNHISRASKELEDKNILRRQRRYHKGGAVGIQYTFNGAALVAAAADQGHPTLGQAITALAENSSAANTKLVSAHSGPITNPEAANTNLVSAQLGPRGREYQFGIRANTKLVPKPEVTEPEEVTLIDEINQSNSGSSGSNMPEAEQNRPPAELPPWYRNLARQLDPAILPDFHTLHEAALLAGWTDKVMDSAARIYARNYRNQRVNDPAALFNKLAIQEASKQPVPKPTAPRQHRYSDEYQRRRL